MLSLVLQVILNVDDWGKNDKKSEETFYQRFASLSDDLFRGTGIQICDREHVIKSLADKSHLNERLFGDDDSASISAACRLLSDRKIAMLIKCGENLMEVYSKEWQKRDLGLIPLMTIEVLFFFLTLLIMMILF